ncbi:MAG TPA: serine/threonine-protein kinase, partial [Kofleriaceae bacterium]|nr:serine/threonine-protein kinase [Kofleriaceae bacterium]
MTDPLIGQVVRERYRVVELIGRGGMSLVYRVEELGGARAWALKRLDARLLGDAAALVRFQREAYVIAQLRHPHVIHVEDWALLDDGSPCMVLELLEGETLAARLDRGGPLDWPELAAVGDQIMSALEAAHAIGVVHCDVSPQNIFLARGADGALSARLL